MAEKRMFAKTIIDSDAFLEMPTSSQNLYFHLGMRADDDGFINNPRKIQKMINCSDDDLKILISKCFIIPFESGVCVIKHWRMHNYIAKDRYKETVYVEEKQRLTIKENKAYSLNTNPLYTECIQDVDGLETQISIGKNSRDKDRLDKNSNYLHGAENSATMHVEDFHIRLPLNDKSLYPVTLTQIYEWQELYPCVDIEQELRKMKGWLDSNPTRRKTSRGIKTFITNWLARQQDKGPPGNKSSGSSSNPFDDALRKEMLNEQNRNNCPYEDDQGLLPTLLPEE